VDTESVIAKHYLEQVGYKVTPIPASQAEKRADLFAESDSDTLAVEVKSRFDEDRIQSAVINSSVGEISPYHVSLEKSNAVSKVISEASKQIKSVKLSKGAMFGVLWFRPQPRIGFLDTPEVLLATLLGVKWAMVRPPEGEWAWMRCYHCNYCDYYRYTDIDATVINTDNEGKILLNTFSPRANDFVSSHIYEYFMSHGAVISPEREEKEGAALILRKEVDLTSESEVAKALEIQYGGYTVKFAEMQSIGGVLRCQ